MPSRAVWTGGGNVPLKAYVDAVQATGFDAIELPVRPGYQCPPEEAAKRLVPTVERLRELGVEVSIVTAPVVEPTDPLTQDIYEACGRAEADGITVFRYRTPSGLWPSTGHRLLESSLTRPLWTPSHTPGQVCAARPVCAGGAPQPA